MLGFDSMRRGFLPRFDRAYSALIEDLDPKSPQDVLATLYRHLQIDTEKQYVNAAGRPISVLPSGAAIDELF